MYVGFLKECVFCSSWVQYSIIMSNSITFLLIYYILSGSLSSVSYWERDVKIWQWLWICPLYQFYFWITYKFKIVLSSRWFNFLKVTIISLLFALKVYFIQYYYSYTSILVLSVSMCLFGIIFLSLFIIIF